MEETQAITARKRKRFDWWKQHAPKEGKFAKKSEKPIKKIKGEKIKKSTKKIPVKEETIETLENNDKKIENDDKKIENDDKKIDNDDKKKRFILFVGNLPFTVNEEQVRNHFRCTDNVKAFRLMTKRTGESKGCGFLEFEDKTSYWKALNLHHSVLAGRKINVEITCGGGGKGENREKKLQERKTKFRERRKTKSKTTKVKSNKKNSSDKKQMSKS